MKKTKWGRKKFSMDSLKRKKNTRNNVAVKSCKETRILRGGLTCTGLKGKGTFRARPHPAKLGKKPGEFCTAKKKQ